MTRAPADLQRALPLSGAEADELREAHTLCHVKPPFEQAMKIPALAIGLRHVADGLRKGTIRRPERSQA